MVNGSPLYTYSVCNVDSSDQDNWLRTTFIQRRSGASRVSVELQFVVRDCNTFGSSSVACKETFNLFLAEADADVGTNFRKGQFRKVATIAPDEITQGNVLKVNTETKTVGSLSKKGFYLAFQDMGACVALLSARVYYKTCPSTVQSLAVFPETVADSLREVEGVCVENAIGQATPRIYCSAEGDWVVPVGQCQCLPGYETTGDSCQGERCQKCATHPSVCVALKTRRLKVEFLCGWFRNRCRSGTAGSAVADVSSLYEETQLPSSGRLLRILPFGSSFLLSLDILKVALIVQV